MNFFRNNMSVIGKVLCCACLTLSFSVFADDAKLNQELAAKFKAADVNHDGKLTLAEAKVGMPRVAAHFSDIDTQNRGYVTLEQITNMADSR
jgi:Ca2+-binding EF-hand superfamily protein